MAISYPLTMPSYPGVTRVTFSQVNAVAISESPWTFSSQTQVHQGQKWQAEFTLPVMAREHAEQWMCFLLQLNGTAGTFMLGDPLQTFPRGNWSGVPVVNGGGQRGNSLAIRGFAAGATIEPGDMFQIGVRLYKYIGTTAVAANGSGQATIDIFPRLREIPADGTGIITITPKGLFRLSSNDIEIYSSHQMEYYEVGVSAVEAL
jgi:hypothetical protein